MYENNSKKFGFSDLKYEFSTNKFHKDSIGVRELFSADFLKTLNIDELCFLNAFWCNRFAKEASDIGLAFSSINSLDLWSDIIKGQTSFDLSDEALIAASQKYNFVSKLLRETFDIHRENIISKEIKEGKAFSAPASKDYTNYYAQLHRAINKDYFKYFSRYLDGSNSFLEDVSFSATYTNLESYAYCKKNSSIEPLIKDILATNRIKNWGIIRNELVDGKFSDSFSTNNNMVLLSFDVEGFNMPFRFHVFRDSLIELVKQSNTNFLIPEYQGSEDFIINNEVIPTNIIMPVPGRHRQTIINNSSNDKLNQKLWGHFYLLMNGKFPNHLTQTIKKNKKQTVKSRLPIYYTDIRTGKRYVKNNNKYVEIDDDYIR